jgi:hypothetical protein
MIYGRIVANHSKKASVQPIAEKRKEKVRRETHTSSALAQLALISSVAESIVLLLSLLVTS